MVGDTEKWCVTLSLTHTTTPSTEKWCVTLSLTHPTTLRHLLVKSSLRMHRLNRRLTRITQIKRTRASLSTIPPKNINMKTIIIDTSAIMAIIGNEPEKPKLIEVTQDAELIAPPSVHWEIGNAFSALFKKRQVTLAQALQAIQAYQQIPILFREVELTNHLAVMCVTEYLCLRRLSNRQCVTTR